uniref:Ig-like domain-containing protein n=1 Tax=Mola mola TaxID=94237 RepID=A0A3Q3XGD8_MOLML
FLTFFCLLFSFFVYFCAGAEHESVLCCSEENLRIIVPLEDIDTQEKSTVSFSCKVNRLNATLKWLKAGEEVSFSKFVVYRVDKHKHTLTVKDCTLADEGEYTAVAGDSKSTAELVISEAPTDFSVHLKDQTITEFEDAEFTCKLTKEKANVKWYRNGREIREGPRYSIICTLRIKECRPDDECEYACGVDEKRSRARLFVEGELLQVLLYDIEEPKLDVDSSYSNNVVVMAGEVFKLEANVTGRPIPSLVWTKEEKELEDTAKIEIKSSDFHTTLINKDSLRRDGGAFTLTASNPGGFAKFTFNVKVLDRPGPPDSLTVTDVTAEKCVLNWLHPTHDGGAKIEYFIIQRRETSRLTRFK